LAYKASVTEHQSLSLQYSQLKSDLSDAYLMAENNYRISRKLQEDFTVKSTLNGLVYSVLREPGELVNQQLPLAVVGQKGAYEIELQVDEYDIVKVKESQKVFITMDSYKGDLFEAAVTRLEPFMNERTRTFTVYAEFTKAPERLFPNLTVEANILIKVKKGALTIPVNYLIGDNRVLISPSETTTVKVGAEDLNFAEIVDGIDAGTTIYLPGE
jgi:multidrug efflux pump subunit AcrA (membrane-fusion protein)